MTDRAPAPSTRPGLARAFYDLWRRELVTEAGARGHLRVRRPDSPGAATNSTVSEGIAYGMILAAAFDDQETFDALWKYSQEWLDRNGLMHWYIDPEGAKVLGEGGATDSDEDIAWSLLLAHDRWGSGSIGEPYLAAARSQIERVWTHEIDHERGDLPMPGDSWTFPGLFNPSYFAPNQYRDFGRATGNVEGWERAIATGYAVLERCQDPRRGNAGNGLVPAWCLDDGTPVPPFHGGPTHHQYDSARTPYRIGQDWLWHREPRALPYLERATSFFAPKGVEGIVDGYDLDGTARPDPDSAFPRRSAVFTGCAAVGAMHDPAREGFVSEAFSALATGTWTTRSRYYNLSWSALCAAMIAGIMPTPSRV